MMAIRLFLLMALVALVGGFIFFSVLKWIYTQRGKSIMKKTLNQANEDAKRKWTEVDQVGELLQSYIRMVIKHGKDSEEATLFKFNVENKNLLGSDKECLSAFNELTDIVYNSYGDKHGC